MTPLSLTGRTSIWERSQQGGAGAKGRRVLQVNSHDYEVGVAPEIGGGLTHLRFRGVDVLRPAPGDADDPLQLACFPLVPYANRIANGQFVWQGRTVTLSPNTKGEPHPLHGDGWRSTWTVAETSPDHIVLELHHAAGDWPWAYVVRQTIHADAGGVGLELEIVNLADAAMPVGLGFHPYFPGRSGARLKASVGTVWLTDAEMLPTRQAPPAQVRDWDRWAPVEATGLIDNCYTQWWGPAEVRLPDRGLEARLTASRNLGCLHVYSPPGEDYFCVEPVSHRPDALNAADPSLEGVAALPPGRRLQASMRIEASPL